VSGASTDLSTDFLVTVVTLKYDSVRGKIDIFVADCLSLMRMINAKVMRICDLIDLQCVRDVCGFAERMNS
jgi:hypothetical protein